ncbi:TadE family protein [Micromonospora parva]|uniref:TadE/TadG family type IV pilus assembly protein n=1 Tax=Micromonospora parva TaxID=1464048 RepID=UPI0033E17CA3
MGSPSRTRQHLRSRLRGDRGSVTTETVGYTVIFLLALTVIVQAAVWSLADQSARHAAKEALQAARVYGATAESGRSEAAEVLAATNPAGIDDIQITVERGPVTTTVTITGTANRVVPVPGLTVPIEVRVQAPTEDVPPVS